MPTTTIQLDSLEGATVKERTFLTKVARPRLEEIINSRAFAEKVCRHRRLLWTRLSNEEVLDRIRRGDEDARGKADYTWNLNLWIYEGRASTVGFTNPDDPVIHMNRNALEFAHDGLAGVLGNIAHEYCHKLGFDHPRRKTPRRKWTVPYAIGTIVESC